MANFKIGKTVDFVASDNSTKNLATEMAKIGTGGGSASLAQLTDVDTTTSAPVSGQVLKYNGTKWTPGTDNTTAGGSTVVDSTTNGNIKVDGAEVQVYDDTIIKGQIGTLANLTTTTKADLVSAVNEVKQGFSKLNVVTSDPASPAIGDMWFRSDL